ncbi:hypothetical protein J2W95_001532 [Flavobacterium granuli]|uniref:Uncharacterized protein n=1 Tax=Flavobacterium granuli TaxID=280093 RepID=A0ABU1S1B0_9FLAO|nr:hypothetical protein [Flavobacterium granuli]
MMVFFFAKKTYCSLFVNDSTTETDYDIISFIKR